MYGVLQLNTLDLPIKRHHSGTDRADVMPRGALVRPGNKRPMRMTVFSISECQNILSISKGHFFSSGYSKTTRSCHGIRNLFRLSRGVRMECQEAPRGNLGIRSQTSSPVAYRNTIKSCHRMRTFSSFLSRRRKDYHKLA